MLTDLHLLAGVCVDARGETLQSGVVRHAWQHSPDEGLLDLFRKFWSARGPIAVAQFVLFFWTGFRLPSPCIQWSSARATCCCSKSAMSRPLNSKVCYHFHAGNRSALCM